MFQSSAQPRRKRFFVARWLRHFIKRLLEEDTTIIPAVNWQRAMKPCILCHATLQKETPFCPHCGTAQQRVTEALQTVDKQNLTNRLASIRKPGERMLDAYNRLMGVKK